MDIDVHNEKLKSSLPYTLTRNDALPVLPKNKLLLYQQYILSKLSLHLTVATLPKTWVIQPLDNVVTRFVHQWLDLPTSATLSSIILPKNQFGFNLQLPSIKFIQCRTVLQNSLQSSQHDAITSLLKSNSQSMNILHWVTCVRTILTSQYSTSITHWLITQIFTNGSSLHHLTALFVWNRSLFFIW